MVEVLKPDPYHSVRSEIHGGGVTMGSSGVVANGLGETACGSAVARAKALCYRAPYFSDFNRYKPPFFHWPRRSMVAPRARGFTLLELLVVIAIIALLIAILLPSLESARRNAKRGVCLAHLKNIATSSRVYEADDPNGWGIPCHPLQYQQDTMNPTFIGAYEWGGKSGIGEPFFAKGNVGNDPILTSKYGTLAGFGPASRPLNSVLYPAGFQDNLIGPNKVIRVGARLDTQLELELFKCPADDGPPRAAHCPDWVANSERSSYDHFGNSYCANSFMISRSDGGFMVSNSPYLRPISRVPNPARTLYYEENIGRWAWAAKEDWCDFLTGVDPGPTKSIRGWHGPDWTYNRNFVDGHAETQKVYIAGTENEAGYANHYETEQLSSYPSFDADNDCHEDTPGDYRLYHCVIIRGPGWQKDTLPASLICTRLWSPGIGRGSYEACVKQADE